jgi:hypothetical protein
MKRAAIAFLATIAAIQPVAAQDASFPCKVLLCSAAANPSWTAIPYCVPIMTQAFQLALLGVAVGICAEARQGSNQSSRPNQGGTLAVP